MKTNNRLKIVLDTNVFLVSLSPHFKNYWIIDKLQKNEYDLLLSSDILNEYAEKINEKFGLNLSDRSLNFILLLDNVFKINPYYHWELITVDHDDNKFVDCAIAGNADFIVTNDKHFNILKTIEFPKVQIMNVEEFKNVFN